MSFSHTLTLASSFVSPRGRRRNRLPPTPLARCLPGLHAQSLRQRPHQASPAPEGVRADGHRGRRRDERALLPDRAGGGRGGSSGSSCRIMSPTRSRCTWCTQDRRSCPSSYGASRSSPRLGCASRCRPTWPSSLRQRPAPKRRSSHLTRGRSFMHDKHNSNSRGKTTGAALDNRLS